MPGCLKPLGTSSRPRFEQHFQTALPSARTARTRITY
jgi:hypothetical protein